LIPREASDISFGFYDVVIKSSIPAMQLAFPKSKMVMGFAAAFTDSSGMENVRPTRYITH
jgi:hypothetical protein